MKFLEFLGGKDFIEKHYSVEHRARIPHMCEFLTPESPSDYAKITEESFQKVYNKDPGWMNKQKKSILKSSEESLSALGEMRAYAVLLDMGFDIIPHGTKKGADFSVIHNADAQKVHVEVATKVFINSNAKEITSGPEVVLIENVYWNPKKGENDVENMTSKIAGIKCDAHQASEDIPTILFLDFQSLALNSSMIEYAHPYLSIGGALYTGALWASFYGEKGMPLVDDLRMGIPCRRSEQVDMKHFGRFSADNKCRFAGAICSFTPKGKNGLCFFENPCRNTVPDWFKVHMICHQNFSLQHSCFAYDGFDIKEYIARQNRRLESMVKLYNAKDKY